MKTSAFKHFTKFVAAAMSAVFAFTLIPMALGQNAVIAAEEITKDQSNTYLVTSNIQNPAIPGSENDTWSGSYVYFGTYNEKPIKFRVLANGTKTFSEITKEPTLFLDSDKILFTDQFDGASNIWVRSFCELNTYLNDTFINGSFSHLEKDAIAESTVSEHSYGDTVPVQDYVKDYYLTGYVPLIKDKIFVLDMEDVSNNDYGYHKDNGSNHIKYDLSGNAGDWWLRSVYGGVDIAGKVYIDGSLGSDHVYDVNGVAPALNINQKSIIFNTKVEGETNAYKLTLSDSNLIIAVPAGQYVTATETTITVPYVISGKDAGTATRASILITKGEWDAEKANIILYDELGASTASSGTFTLPSGYDLSGWGTDYHVYILAEDINGEQETDYASTPVEIALTQTYTVTYKVANGTWSDGTTADLTETVAEGASPASVPTGMNASSGYEKGEWNTDPSTASISADTIFTYSFKAIPTYTVTVQNDGNGTATANVTSGSEGTEVTLTATPSSGYQFKEWQVVSGGVTVTDNKFTIGTSDVTVKAVFEAIPTYTVTVQNDGNGTATADVTSGPEGTEVTLTATPSSGYQFKEWQVVSGGVTVTDNKFTIGTSDVTVKAVFEAEPVSIEPPKSTGPFTYTVVSGGDATWTEGDPDLVVKVTSDEDGDHSFERYEYTAIDGTKLTDEQAPASSGSTVITIKSDLLKTLSEGKHTILINFSDNSITTTVTIVKKAAGTSNVPSTGEVIGVSAIAGTVLILSACSILIVMRTKKREDEL